MDPFSITAGIAGLLSLSLQVSQIVTKHIESVKDAQQEAHTLSTKLNALISVLQQLEKFIEKHARSGHFSESSVLYGTIKRCEGSLQQLDETLSKFVQDTTRDSRSWRRWMRWPLSRAKHQQTVTLLHEYLEVFNLSMSLDGWALASSTAQDVQSYGSDLSHRMSELIGSVKTLEERVNAYHASLSSLQQSFTNQNRSSLLSWISSSVDPSLNHNRATRLKESGTGQWFLETDEFYHWYHHPGFLWLHGIPGSGKTVLCSTIIRAIAQACELFPDQRYAYFYFDFQETQRQQVEPFLRSLITQLLAHEPTVPDSIIALHEDLGEKRLSPSLEALESALSGILESSSKDTFIFLDALDEVSMQTASEERKEILRILSNLATKHGTKLHILATSRDELDIREAIARIPNRTMCLEEAAVDSDITAYVQSCLSDPLDRLSILSESLKSDIAYALRCGARGMFRWAVCQLHALRQCRRPRDIQKALTQLPATLDETYERILRQLDNEYQPEARAILFWLVSSKRTLTLLELGEAAVIQPTDRQFDLGARFSDASEVLRILGSLITYSMQSNSQELVRFAHYSVQEYLLSGRSATFPTNIETSQQHVTSSCLLYLNHLKLIPDDHLHQYPLLNYVATYWFPHLQEAREVDRITTEFACSLLTKDFTTHAPKWLSVYEPCTEIHGGRELQQTLRYPGALYYAVYLNLLQAVAVLLETGVNVNELHGFGTQDNGTDPEYMVNNDRKRSLVHRQMATHRRRNTTRYRNRLGLSVHGSRIILRQCQTVLHLAVFLGFQPMVELLLELGADPNVKASIGSPLPTFSVESRVGRSEHSGDERCESALGDAVKHNDLNMVKVLLDHGAQADVSCGRYPALNYAARYGDWSIVSYLLSAGADPNVTDKTLKPCCYPRALLLACSQLFVAGVKDLVHAGAHVNRTDAACTALQVACYSEPQASFSRLPLPARLTISWKPRRRDSLFIAQSLEICEILLGAGADPNLVGRDVARGSPLSEAAKQDSAALMVLLLNNGANCDGAPHPDSITPLAAAVAQGHLAAARLLISFGANVNLSPYDASPIPLALAASRGDLVTIQLLLDAGAHIDAYCKAALEEPLSYALLAAAAGGYENVVRLLLDRGASVLPPAPQHRHAITAAACKGFSRVVEMLIRAGADINAERCIYKAAKKKCWHIVNMLIKAGADIHGPTVQRYQPELIYLASSVGCEEVVGALIDAGTDINANGCLQQAAKGDHWDTVRLLLDAGADVHAPGAMLSPLPPMMYSAARAGQSDMVQLFLRAGLDPSREHDGKTPLTMALRGGHTETAKLLLDFKANHGPAAAGYIEIRSLILQRRKAREAQREHLHETFDIGNGTLTTPSST